MSLSPFKRLKKASEIKAFPLKEWTIFTRRHSGNFWFLYWPFPYIRALVGYRNLNYSPTFKQEAKAQTKVDQ